MVFARFFVQCFLASAQQTTDDYAVFSTLQEVQLAAMLGMLGPCWAHVGAVLGHAGPCGWLTYVESILGLEPCWAMLAPHGNHVEAMSSAEDGLL